MSMLSPHIPQLLSSVVTGTADRPVIDLQFNVDMRAGMGTIYITDGAAQTMIDRATGLTTMRIVGGTDTHQIAAGNLTFSANHLLIDAPGLKPGHTYSVFIAPGALASSTGQLFAGIRTGDLASFTAPGGATPDTTGPTLVSIAPDGGVLKAGQNIEVTFTFSEKVLTPSPAAFNTPHATFGSFHTDDGGLTWHATLRADSPFVDVAANTLAVDMALITDLAGNAGTGPAPAFAYAVDTMVSSHVMPGVYLYDDRGPSGEDFITNGTTHLIEGTIKDVMGPDQHFWLLINGIPADPDHVTLVRAEGGPGGHGWSYLGPLAEGTNTITAYVEDENGHSSAAVTQVIVIDNDAPEILSSPHGSSGFDVTTDIVVTFDQEMFWSPSEGREADVLVVDGHGNQTFVPVSWDNLSEDGMTFTIRANQHGLATGNDYTITLPSTLTDLAGNRPSAPIALHTAGEPVDTAAPRAIRAEVMNDPGSYGVGAVIEIRVILNEDVTLVAGATPQLVLDGNAVATFDKLENAREMVFKYTVAAGDNFPVLQIVDDSSLAGSVVDLAGKPLGPDGIGYSWLKNHHLDSTGSEIEIDTVAPAAVMPLLVVGSDTVDAANGVTADTTPTFTGSGAEAGATIELYEGSTRLGWGTVNEQGVWSLTSGDLLDGPHHLDFYQVDAAGNTSLSTGIALAIDTVAPGPLGAAPVLEEVYMSDYSDTDGITKDVTPTFSGSGAEANATIVLMSGSEKIGEGVAGPDGNWRIDTNVLSEGVHWITAKQIDKAGNESALSPAAKVDIDTSAPTLVGVAAGRPILPADTTTFVVRFSDLLIIPDSTGEVTVKMNGSPLYGNGNATWSIEHDETGHAYHVLTLSGLLPSAYDIHFQLRSPMNVAGIVGVNLLQNDILFEIAPPSW